MISPLEKLLLQLLVIPAQKMILSGILKIRLIPTLNGTIYTGVTSNLIQRDHQHTGGFVDGFTKKYDLHKLVYYEIHMEIN